MNTDWQQPRRRLLRLSRVSFSVRVVRVAVLIWGAAASSLLGQTVAVGRWTFDRLHVAGTTVTNQAGPLHGQIQGRVSLASKPDALVLDGTQNYVVLSESMDTTQLPQSGLAVEATVAFRSAG